IPFHELPSSAPWADSSHTHDSRSSITLPSFPFKLVVIHTASSSVNLIGPDSEPPTSNSIMKMGS
ncbi:hypothetical protein Csa_010416, partial [Cucumis sativus]